MADLTRRLARLRVPLGFLFALLVIWLARPTGTLLLAGSAVALVGEALRIWAAGHLNKSREVTSSGPYRHFAHPLYVGSSIMGVGLAIASGSLAVALLIAIYMGATITAAVRSEEAFLRQKFGDQYDRYRRGEAGARDAGATTRRFTVAQAMANHEYRAVTGLVLAVLLLCLKAAYNGAFWRAAGTQ
ncbi:MAG: isoprenylcysteine carboxylmethyltransferase family protein [Vicinamibacterales bacterium]